MDSDSEPELISLVTQLMSSDDKPTYTHGLLSSYSCPKLIPIITQITSLVGSMDLDSQPKPESKLMSVVAQTISLFHSIDLDSQPKPLSELISLLISKSSKDADLDPELVSDLVTQTLLLQTEPELISLIHQIFSLVVSMNAKWKKLISLCPQFEAWMNDEKFVYENTAGGRDYDEDKQCHACITPIYFW
ncbi:DC1 domain-containing protein [Raphanus sativus]|nr:DC1 domain-containing protein [Raphanus sativus]